MNQTTKQPRLLHAQSPPAPHPGIGCFAPGHTIDHAAMSHREAHMSANLIFTLLSLQDTLPTTPKHQYFSYKNPSFLHNYHQNATTPCCRVTRLPPYRSSRYHDLKFQTSWLMNKSITIWRLFRAWNPPAPYPGIVWFAPGAQNRFVCTAASKYDRVNELEYVKRRNILRAQWHQNIDMFDTPNR